jgi:WhiB family redox-sensing transcriptional regulator
MLLMNISLTRKNLDQKERVRYGMCSHGDPERRTLQFMPDSQQWRRRGRCTTIPLERVNAMFYFERGGKSKEAKEFCSRCPVQTQCLAFALQYNERGGVFGGLTEKERDNLPSFFRVIALAADIDRNELRGTMDWVDIVNAVNTVELVENFQ